ncbi:MMPL family transporter [Nocardia sp. BMG51109]|uniref:MMPL family transporter n=1 Tax=Nocardia sp. BMG51109 TaxID=1056816 RepID=UPI001E2DA9D7|nr:MMPL family transporter [Nocardia sp. BMG51109]
MFHFSPESKWTVRGGRLMDWGHPRMLQFDFRTTFAGRGPARRWADFLVARRYSVVVVGVLVALLAGAWGAGVFDRLNLAGYTVPGSQSSAADDLVGSELGRRTPDVVVHYSVSDGRTLADVAPEIGARLESVDRDLLARPVESFLTADATRRPAFVSGNREGLAVLSLAGDDTTRLQSFQKLRDTLVVPGIDTSFSGYSAVTDAYNTESKNDLARVEIIALPLTLLVLILIFGSVVAACIPVIIGVLTIVASLAFLRVLSEFTDVSSFAVNTASIIGLGMAIDYGLLTVSRFREELSRSGDVARAVRVTTATASRTVLFSGSILVCAFLGMLVFPVSAMRSLGFGAMSAVAVSACLSVTVVPAALAVLGHRIDALSLQRGRVRSGEDRSRRFWERFATATTRRPILLATGVIAILLLFTLPVSGVRMANLDSSGLPADNPARLAQEMIVQKFPNATNGADLVVRGADGGPPSEIAVDDLIARAGVTDGVRFALATDRGRDFAIVHVVLTDTDFTTPALDTVERLRSLPPPPDSTVLVGGENAVNADSYRAIVTNFPKMALAMLAAILVLMFLAFRSVLLPVKAVVMAALSLAASLGVVTWIFQGGHAADLFGITPGPLPVAGVVIVVATVFGLSTDYEVFLLARMLEAREAGADTRNAVIQGVAGTGRVVTAAAALLVIVTGAAAASGLSIVKLVGLGMVVAILVDATLVRMILVPALVVLMGEANWWSPFGKRRQGSRVPAERADAVEPAGTPEPERESHAQ